MNKTQSSKQDTEYPKQSTYLFHHLVSALKSISFGFAICKFCLNDAYQRDYMIIYANEQFQKFFVHHPQKFLLKSVIKHKIVPNFSSKEFIENLYIELLQHHERQQYFYDGIHELWFKINFYLYQADHFVIIMEDITRQKLKEIRFETAISEKNEQMILTIAELKDENHRRKDTEIKLAKERNLLNSILNTSPVAITMVNQYGKITFANSNAEKILNLTKDTITSRTYNDPLWKIETIKGEPFPQEKLPFNVVKNNKAPVFNIVHTIVNQNGERKILSINASPILDKEGKFEGMVSHLEDITRMLSLESKLNCNTNDLDLILREIEPDSKTFSQNSLRDEKKNEKFTNKQQTKKK